MPAARRRSVNRASYRANPGDAARACAINLLAQVKATITQQPQNSVLALADFTGAHVDKDVAMRIKEVLVFEKALQAAGKTYALHFYTGAQHGFNNDTNKPRYNEAAAKEAWGRTMAWFQKYLG